MSGLDGIVDLREKNQRTLNALRNEVDFNGAFEAMLLDAITLHDGDLRSLTVGDLLVRIDECSDRYHAETERGRQAEVQA